MFVYLVEIYYEPPYGVLYKTKLVTWVVLLLLGKIYYILLKISDKRNVKKGSLFMRGVLVLCRICQKDFRCCLEVKE